MVKFLFVPRSVPSCEVISKRVIWKTSPTSKRESLSPKAEMLLALNSVLEFIFTDWVLSLYLITVLPGVKSMDSPEAALEI